LLLPGLLLSMIRSILLLLLLGDMIDLVVAVDRSISCCSAVDQSLSAVDQSISAVNRLVYLLLLLLLLS
jgi:hypothetical protein